MNKYICSINKEECDVVVNTPDVCGESLSEKVLQRLLPCSNCRKGEDDARVLSGVRLGKHERRILLLAPGPGEELTVIDPEDAERATEESHRRAIRKLAGIGLLSLIKRMVNTSTRSNSKRNGYRTNARLSPLGQAVVNRVRTELTEGKPIRWHLHQDVLVSDIRLTIPELVEIFMPRFHEKLEMNADLNAIWRK